PRGLRKRLALAGPPGRMVAADFAGGVRRVRVRCPAIHPVCPLDPRNQRRTGWNEIRGARRGHFGHGIARPGYSRAADEAVPAREILVPALFPDQEEIGAGEARGPSVTA